MPRTTRCRRPREPSCTSASPAGSRVARPISSSWTRSSATTSSRRPGTAPSSATRRRAAGAGRRRGSPPRDCAPRRARTRTRLSALLHARVGALSSRAIRRRLALLPTARDALYTLGRLDDAYGVLDEAIEGADPDTAAAAFFFKSYAQRSRRVGLAVTSSSRTFARSGARSRARERCDARGRASDCSGGRSTGAGGSAAASAGGEAGRRACARRRRLGRSSWGDAAGRPAKLHGDVPWPRGRAAARPRWPRRASMRPGAASDLGAGDAGAHRRGAAASPTRSWPNEREHGRLMSVYTRAFTWRSMIEVAARRPRARERDSCARAGTGFGALGERGTPLDGRRLPRRDARPAGRLDEAEAILDEAIGISTPDDWVTVAAGHDRPGVRRLRTRGPRARVRARARGGRRSSTRTSTSPCSRRSGSATAEILLAAGTRRRGAGRTRARPRGRRRARARPSLVDRVDELLAPASSLSRRGPSLH